MLIRRRNLLLPFAHSLQPSEGLEIRPRAEWTEVGFRGEPEAEDVRFLLVHHTAATTQHEPGDVPGILRGIRSYHVESKGWGDIAYNFLIDRHGTVWEGREGSLSGPVRGDATGGNQGFSQLVCLIGDFTEEPPTAAAQQSLVQTLAWLAEAYEIDVREGARVSFVSMGSNRWPEGAEVATTPIAGHRDMSYTSCPGDAFYPLLSEVITPRVREVLLPTTSTSTSTSTSTTSTPTSTPDPTTTTATSPASTTVTTSTTLVPPVPRTSIPLGMAAEQTDEGWGLAGWSAASVLVGLGAGLLSWRVRRMGSRST